MPEIDGFDVLNYVAEHRRSLPVILLSGMKPDEIQGKMLQLHDRTLPLLLLKPVDPEQLVRNGRIAAFRRIALERVMHFAMPATACGRDESRNEDATRV